MKLLPYALGAAFGMFAVQPVFAQVPLVQPDDTKAVTMLLNRERSEHQADLSAALKLQDQVADLTKKSTDLEEKNKDLQKKLDEAPKTPAPATPSPQH